MSDAYARGLRVDVVFMTGVHDWASAYRLRARKFSQGVPTLFHSALPHFNCFHGKNMPFGELIIGPPGSGKSTYAYGLYQFLNALERPVIIVNLDPAASSPPYPSSISITSLISLQDAMTEHKLGPNGAMLYCLEYLEANVDWLDEELGRVLAEKGLVGNKREQAFVVFDTPGQVELSTDHGSLKRVVEHLGKKGGWRLAAVHLLDAHHILDAGKYVALLLLSLRTMLQMELPHINVLSKIDLLASAGELPFNLDFYTEVKDLEYLLPLLEENQRTRRFSELNRVICELIDEFGLVSFETLCVEDKESMLRLVQVVDQAIGYVAPTPLTDPSMSMAEAHDHHHAHQSQLPSMLDPISQLYYNSTVQEKWIDHREEYAEHERKMWEREGDKMIDEANKASTKSATEFNEMSDDQ